MMVKLAEGINQEGFNKPVVEPKKPTPYYKTAAKERALISSVDQEFLVREAYERFFTPEPISEDKFGRPHGSSKHVALFKDEYVSLYEDAWMKNKGNIPMDFFLQFEKEDLQYFINTVPPDISRDLHYIWQAETDERAFQRMVDEELERQLASDQRRNSFGSGFSLIPYEVEQIGGEEKAKMREKIEQQFKGIGVNVEPGFWQHLNKMLPLIMGPIGWAGMSKDMTATDVVGYTLDKGLGAVAPLLGVAQDAHESGFFNVPGLIMSWRESELEAQRLKDIEEIQGATGYGQAYAFQMTWNDAQVEWDQMDQEDKDFWVDAGSGSETVAMGLFISDRNSDPEVEEQMEQYVSEYDASVQDQIRVLNETEFSDKETLLDGLASWGNLTGDFAVGFMLFATGEVEPGEFGRLFNEIKEYNHSPAEVMGWEGTVLGIGFDFGMMTIFDPTTYMFGGGAASATGRGVVRTQTQGVRLLKSAEVVNKIAEVGRAAVSPATSHAAMVTMAGLDSIGMQQLFRIKNLTNQVFASGNKLWRKAFPSADEVLTEHIAGLIPAASAASDAAGASKAILKRGGFNRPIQIDVGSAGAVIHPADVSAARAAVDNGWNTVPVQINVVDDVVQGYTPAQIQQMRDLSDFQATASTRMTEGNVRMDMEIWKEMADPADTVLGSFSRGSQSYTVKTRPFDSHATRVLGTQDQRTLWYITDNTGEVIGGYDGTHFLLNRSHRGQGIMSDFLKVTEDAGQSFLPRMLDRASSTTINSFTEDAAAFVRREVAARLNGKTFLDNPQSLDDVWGGAASIPSAATPGPLSPDAFFDKAKLFGGSDLQTQLENIYRGQIMRNGRLEDMTYTAMARGFQSLLKKVTGMTDNQFVAYTKRYFTQRNLSRTFNTANTHAMDDAMDYLYRLWGDDTDALNGSIQKLIDIEQGVAGKQALLETQAKRLAQLDEDIARASDELGLLPDIVPDEVRAATAEFQAARASDLTSLKALKDEAAAIRAEAVKVRSTLPDNRQIFEILDQAIDDFNRKYLATMDSWKKMEGAIDPKTGLVRRDVLRKGINPTKGDELANKKAGRTTTGFAEGSTEEAAEMSANESGKTLRKISSTAPDNYDFGVSALDLAVAREGGGAVYMKYTQERWLHSVREVGFQVYNAWIIDKVIRPATAAVVTIDEAMRVVHLYGFEAFRMYMQDKMWNTEARVAAAFRGHNPLAREAVGNGASALSAKGQERIRRLQDWGAKLRADERTFFDQHGIGWVDIDTNDPLYRSYAQQWTTQFTNDSGFRAFMQGDTAFSKWWDESSDAARLREKTINVKKGSRPPTKEEVYQGWETMWKILSSEADKSGKLRDFTRMWRETLDEIEVAGKNVPLPEAVFDNFIPVRGAQKIGGGPVTRMTDAFFDRLFMDPVNYRRGFIAEMVRHTEMKRLRQFYASQGKQIVPDSQLTDMMRLSGYSSGDIGMPEALHHFWADSNYIPESYVRQTIERTVHKEIENMLYVWNMGSRAGGQARMAFPFGKPYADMMGFWGREMLRKPVMKGFMNNENYLALPAMAEKLPFNPKTGALLSRMAATNFEVTRGWIPEQGDMGEGLLPGSTSTDLSPLFFLPTEGDDILGSTLPGLGYLPLWMIDIAMKTLGPDPVEDPVGYNNLLQSVGEILPYVEYEQGGTLSRVVGGGSLSTLFSAAVDVQGYFGGKTYFNVTSELGDIGREIRRAREVSVLMADPATIAEIAKIKDPELLELYINGVVSDANKAASATHFGETMTRWTVPAKVKYDSTGAELQQVWLDAASQFPDVFRTSPGIGLDTPEGKRQYADDIRNRFFDLPGWQRDMLIAAQPALAVNMVSSWDWTPKAIDEGMPNSDLPYSTGGTPADLLRHDYFVNNGYVRPIQPAQRARLILGQIAEARDNAIKHVYQSTAKDVNDIIWADIEGSGALFEYMEELQATYGERFGTKDARHLWENWGTLEPLMVDIMEAEEGEDFSEGRSLGIPADAKPWSMTFPGLDETSRKFAALEDITLNPEAEEIVRTLGLEFTPGMTGDQFHRMLADRLAENDTLAHGMYRPAWDQFTQERLAFSNSASAQLTKAKYDSNNAQEWRNALIEWDVRVGNLKEQYRDAPQGIPTDVRQKVLDEFNSLVAGSKDSGTIPWETIWRGAYAPVFGPLKWTPPEPAPPFDEDGAKSGNTRVPIIHMIVDGDTMIFSETSDSAKHAVRLLGVSADEYSYDPDAAEQDRKRLSDAIEQARINGDRIYLVTDPDRFVTNTDRYGRMLAWLWIGDKPFYFADEMNPKFTPSGSKE